MARALADIERDIRALSEEERAALLRKLIDDLDAPGEPEVEAAWLQESERRLNEIEDGTAKTFPADDVIKEARSRLK
jgi:putative addiction module component (TIGR02574 family)